MVDQKDSWLKRMQSRIVLRAGENSVVDNTLLPNVADDKAIVLTNEVYATLQIIADATNVRKIEVPFWLYGKFDTDNQMFIFDDIDADASAGDNRYETVFSHELEQKVLDFGLGAIREQNKIVAYGHSHPRVGGYYLNFSLGDMRAVFGMRNKSWLQNVWVLGCLLTGGNFNFVFCNGDDVYRVNNVFVYDKRSEKFSRLPCFGPDVEKAVYVRERER